MTRALSSPTLAELAKAVTQPGYFVEILFASPLRLCSRGTVVWSGNTWVGWDVQVGGLSVDAGSCSQEGTLTLGDTDSTITALVLNERMGGRAVRVWGYYGNAPATDDPVLLFAGVGDEVTITPHDGRVMIGLKQEGGTTLFCPRKYITADEGFHFVPPNGTVFTWNGETIRLTSEGA